MHARHRDNVHEPRSAHGIIEILIPVEIAFITKQQRFEEKCRICRKNPIDFFNEPMIDAESQCARAVAVGDFLW